MDQESKQTVLKRGRARATNRSGQESKEAVFNACRDIIVTEGLEKLSLERIAQRAGMAKSNLLYHFHDRDRLLSELMDRYVAHLQECLDRGIEAAQEKHPGIDPTVGGFIEWYRAYYQEDSAYSTYGLLVLSLSVGKESLLEPVRRWYERLFENLRHASTPSTEAMLVIVALEGLFFLRHYRVDAISKAEIDALLARLETIALGSWPQNA